LSNKFTSPDLENGHKLFDRLVVHLHKLHFCIEDKVNSHINLCRSGSFDLVNIGVMLTSLELRSPLHSEKTQFFSDDKSTETFNIIGSRVLNVQKVLKCVGLRVYSKRRIVADSIDTQSQTENDLILHDLSFTAAFAAGFQKNTQIFGPSTLKFVSDSIRLHISDDQMFVIHHIAQVLRTYFYNLRSKSRLAMSNQKPPPSSVSSTSDGVDQLLSCEIRKRRARMRWALIRKAVQIDWWQFTDSLAENDVGGSLKWRSWFKIWRLAARYVAIRQIVTFHVGYESFLNAETGFTTYAAKEKLLMDYERLRGGTQVVTAYDGLGCFDVKLIATAELLISSKYERRDGPQRVVLLDGNDSEITIDLNALNPFSIPDKLIRVLYAAQLELDSILPFRVSAFCRILADEKCELYNRTMQMPCESEDSVDGITEQTLQKFPVQISSGTLNYFCDFSF